MRLWIKFALSASVVTGVAAGTFQSVLLNAPSSSVFLSQQDAPTGMDMMAAVEASLGQIERTNETLPAVFNLGPTPQVQSNPVVKPERRDVILPDVGPIPTKRPVEADSGVCTDCSTPRVTNIRYMQCNSRNNYLESRLAKLTSSGSLMGSLVKGGPKANTIIKPICMKTGLESRFGARSNSFKKCDVGDQKGSKGALRPCISENYFSLMNNAFDLASRCMAPILSSDQSEQKSDIRAVFSMMNIESGMHMNAISPTGASGIGQFTSDAIKSVNRNEIEKVRKMLTAQGGKCAQLSSEILSGRPPMRPETSRSCDRVSLERGNPLINIIYSYASLAASKKEIADDVITDRRYKKFFTSLSHAQKNRLQTSLSVWAHNTGSAGLRTPLMALLNSKYRGKTVTNVDTFLQEMVAAVRDYPHRANSGRARRRETSKYWPAIQDTMAKMERNAGGGSCVTQ